VTRTRLPLLALSSLSLLAACSHEASAPGSGPDAGELRVAAAASLKELLATTNPLFSAAHGHVKIVDSLEASSTLSRQIEAAGGYDCFLSADAGNLDRLGARVVAATRAEFLRNELVVVARAGLSPLPTDAASLAGVAGRVALAGEAVPVGKYARAWLEKAGCLDALRSKIVNGDDVRAALGLVESGAADAAVVYETDALVAKSAKVAFRVPAREDPGVVYVAAAVTGAKSPLAAQYVAWLRSAEFQKRAVELGFKSATQ
jgi:molybdate transport system substrate-binding protein